MQVEKQKQSTTLLTTASWTVAISRWAWGNTLTGILCQTLLTPHAKMHSTAQGRCLSLLTLYCSICTVSVSRQHFPKLFKCHTEASSRVLRCSEDKEFSHFITLRSCTRCRQESRSKFICGGAAGTLNYILHPSSLQAARVWCVTQTAQVGKNTRLANTCIKLC